MIRPADLHSHSTASDGLLPPEKLVELAEKAGISVLALTDHDTLAGLAGLSSSALHLIPGVEISVEDGVTLHILGLGINLENAPLQKALRALREGRWQRMEKMLALLNEYGVPVQKEDLTDFLSPGTPPGRGHLSRAMVAKGYCSSMKECFERYIGNGKKAYIACETLGPSEAFALIDGAGGLPVLAHPGLVRLPQDVLAKRLLQWKAQGLRGLEAHHHSHTVAQARNYDAFARENGLMVTGGSDFHGDGDTHGALGTGMDAWLRCREDVDALFAHWGKSRVEWT